MTWSIAGVADRVWDFLSGVERVTRPPRLGHPFYDWDESLAVSPDGYYGYAEPDLYAGAERLADAEAEIDSWEPDEVPNPYEPGLSDLELIGVRGLLQERYDPTFSPAAGARAAGTSPSEVSGPPPEPPSEGCPDPSLDQRRAGALGGEGGAPDSGIHTSPGAPQPEFQWEGWSIPAVLEVLTAHIFRWASHDSIGSNAHCSCGFRPRDLFAWHDHVAPEIVARIGCDPARAIAALHNHKPQK